RGWRQLRPAAPPGRTDAVARVLVAPLHRPGGPDRHQHGRGPARDSLLDRRAAAPARKRPVPPDLLARPQGRGTAAGNAGRGAERWHVDCADDVTTSRLRDVPGGPRPSPPGPQPAG